MPSPALNVRQWRVSVFTARQPQCSYWPAKAVTFMGRAWEKQFIGSKRPVQLEPDHMLRTRILESAAQIILNSLPWTFMVPFSLVHLSQEVSFKSRQETDVLAGCQQAWGCKQGYPHKTHEAPCGSAGQAREKRGKMTWSWGRHCLPAPLLCQVTVQNWKGYKNKAWGHLWLLVPWLGIKLVLPALEAQSSNYWPPGEMTPGRGNQYSLLSSCRYHGNTWHMGRATQHMGQGSLAETVAPTWTCSE